MRCLKIKPVLIYRLAHLIQGERLIFAEIVPPGTFCRLRHIAKFSRQSRLIGNHRQPARGHQRVHKFGALAQLLACLMLRFFAALHLHFGDFSRTASHRVVDLVKPLQNRFKLALALFGGIAFQSL
ncbi:MAG: hypothetical protein WCP06_01690 [Verrucomicrobiota bacterium]